MIDSVCVLCGDSHQSGSCLCADCLNDLPLIRCACLVCGRPLPQQGFCGRCQLRYSAINRTVSAFQYHYPAARLIKNIKYNQWVSMIPPLANALAERIKKEQRLLPEILLPVPLHWARLYKRGFNQSVEICKTLKAVLNIRYDDCIAKRVRRTRPMSLLNPSQRSANIRGAFKLVNSPAYKSIAIVDDVVTSGATAHELARLLKSSGVEWIELWVLARA